MANRWRVVGLMCVVATILAFGWARSFAQGNAGGESEIQRGFDIAPVELNLKGLNRAMVGRGSYYVNGVSVCAGCHTGSTGYLGGGNPFGPVFSRNITPDFSGRPAGLTLAEFKEVMREGTDFKNLFPPGPLIVMPWPEYQHGTNQWVESVYEYLRAVPCVEGGPGNQTTRC